MQIAQIVPNRRTGKTDVFDYAIPAALLPKIKIGILVEIPFHGRQTEGVVLDLKRHSSLEKLENISKVLDPEPVINESHIKLSRWMSDYYFTPLGKTIFEHIPPPAKRILKNRDTSADFVPSFPIKSRPRNKTYLIVGDFSRRLQFYLEAIKKTLAQHKTVIILIPDLAQSHFFSQNLPCPYSLFSSKLRPTELWLEWDKIRHGRIPLVIGSHKALLAPLPNLGLIIVDQEENETYKNDRAPRYHAVRVAEELAKFTTAKLLLGSLTPRVESYYQALKNNYVLKRSLSGKKPEIELVMMNQELNPLSQPLQEKITANLEARQKIILVLNRKGEGIKYSCPDCQWIAFCQECGLPLVPQGDELACFRCEKKTLPPELCPKCSSAKLRPFGLGTTRLEKFVRDLWPDIRLVRLEEGHSLPPSRQWDMIIATNYALKFNFPKIGLVAIIDADQALNFPTYLAAEKAFQNFYKFLRLGEEGIIQTNLPENPTLQALGRLDYEKFFLGELSLRHKLAFPPFVNLIRLVNKNKDEVKAQDEAIKLKETLSQKLQAAEILGPAPAFYRERRGFYRWQLLVKIRDGRFDPRLQEIFKTLPKSWILDRDPLDLL